MLVEHAEPIPFRLTTSATVDTPSDARHQAHEFLVEQDVSEALLEPAGVVLTELVTNAVSQGGFDVELSVRIDGDAVRLSVTYATDEAAPHRVDGVHDGGGWSMRVIDELATRWDIHPRTDGRHGNVLWAEILLA